MTSNRPLEEWGKLLGDVPSAPGSEPGVLRRNPSLLVFPNVTYRAADAFVGLVFRKASDFASDMRCSKKSNTNP